MGDYLRIRGRLIYRQSVSPCFRSKDILPDTGMPGLMASFIMTLTGFPTGKTPDIGVVWGSVMNCSMLPMS